MVRMTFKFDGKTRHMELISTAPSVHTISFVSGSNVFFHNVCLHSKIIFKKDVNFTHMYIIYKPNIKTYNIFEQLGCLLEHKVQY